MLNCSLILNYCRGNISYWLNCNMQEIPYILTEWQELNSLIYAPLSATKRIQYTCIAVSTNYIALGATSGSVYLFSREPCAFQQLIPLLEGAVFRVQISPDEKNIALATVRGSICLVVLKPNAKLVTVSTEHLGEKVTCLCWNDNSTEVYAGDDTGKISVSILPSFMVNGMFQSSSCVLMTLDTKIVQMNFASPLLLISTLNRCYICDTLLEQYKQIGNKPRDGEFGACFLKTHSADSKVSELSNVEPVSNLKQVFRLSGEIVNGAENEESLPKIYCARPGSRLWEVTANGVVMKTHQFKEALAIPPLPVYKPSIGKLLKLKKHDQTWPVQSINFPQLIVISDKYLFTHTSNGLYIIDPQNAEVVLWNDEFPDIFMAHTISDKIYLMTSSGVFHCLTLASINSLILKLYDKKSYKECWEMCQILRPQLVSSIVEPSCDIDIKESADLPESLGLIISVIKSNENTQPKKLGSGIVIVNDGNKNSNNGSLSIANKMNDETLVQLEDQLILFNVNGSSNANNKTNVKNINTTNGELKNGLPQEVNKNLVQETESENVSSLQKTICNLQEDLESLYILISTQMLPNITEEQLDEIIKLFIENFDSIKKKYEVTSQLQNYLFEVIRSAELNYCNCLLDNLPLEILRKMENQEILKHLVRIYVDVNLSKYTECSCGFPYPIFGVGPSKSQEPKFLDIGKVLLDKLSVAESDNMCLKFCNQIPYMWRDYLSLKGCTKGSVTDNLLKQCLQSRDNFALLTILPLLDKQQWKMVAQCFESIKNGRCVSCSKPYDSEQVSKEFAVDWAGITQFIIKKQGPRKAMTFLFQIHENLPQVNFDKSIYQSIIFSSILSHHGVNHAIELDQSNVEHNSICSPRVLHEVTQAVEKDLEETVSKDAFGSGPHHWGMRYNLVSSTCPCCTLSLQTPVLLGNNGIALFPCGHAYHVNCMIQKKISRCNLHAQ